MKNWDLWTHLSHLTVHWIPMSSMDSPKSLDLIRNIVQNEMDMLKENRQHSRETNFWFAGERVSYVPSIPTSHVHCLGDNFVRKQAPCYISCQVRYMCVDMTSREFVVFPSTTQQKLDSSINNVPDGDFISIGSRTRNSSVMTGKNIRFSTNLAWFPTIRQLTSKERGGFYELPQDIFLIPFSLEPTHASNPGHLLWDYFLPFFTLLSMYHYGGQSHHDSSKKRMMLIDVDDACFVIHHCRKMVAKFLQLLGLSEFVTMSTVDLVQHEVDPYPDHTVNKSNLVCSRDGAVGIGMLTDHGYNRHGQNLDDYQHVHNSGRGHAFYAFRSFMVENILDSPSTNDRRVPKIVFSVNSTDNRIRRKDFASQIEAVQRHIPGASVMAVELARLSIKQQVELVVDASVFVSVVGGSTSLATMLPRRAAVILYFCTEDSFVGKTKKKDFPTMMDFDFWNNASHLRLHWLPSGSMNQHQDIEFLVQLIQSELETIPSP